MGFITSSVNAAQSFAPSSTVDPEFLERTGQIRPQDGAFRRGAVEGITRQLPRGWLQTASTLGSDRAGERLREMDIEDRYRQHMTDPGEGWANYAAYTMGTFTANVPQLAASALAAKFTFGGSLALGATSKAAIGYAKTARTAAFTASIFGSTYGQKVRRLEDQGMDRDAAKFFALGTTGIYALLETTLSAQPQIADKLGGIFLKETAKGPLASNSFAGFNMLGRLLGKPSSRLGRMALDTASSVISEQGIEVAALGVDWALDQALFGKSPIRAVDFGKTFMDTGLAMFPLGIFGSVMSGGRADVRRGAQEAALKTPITPEAAPLAYTKGEDAAAIATPEGQMKVQENMALMESRVGGLSSILSQRFDQKNADSILATVRTVSENLAAMTSEYLPSDFIDDITIGFAQGATDVNAWNAIDSLPAAQQDQARMKFVKDAIGENYYNVTEQALAIDTDTENRKREAKIFKNRTPELVAKSFGQVTPRGDGPIIVGAHEVLSEADFGDVLRLGRVDGVKMGGKRYTAVARGIVTENGSPRAVRPGEIVLLPMAEAVAEEAAPAETKKKATKGKKKAAKDAIEPSKPAEAGAKPEILDPLAVNARNAQLDYAETLDDQYVTWAYQTRKQSAQSGLDPAAQAAATRDEAILTLSDEDAQTLLDYMEGEKNEQTQKLIEVLRARGVQIETDIADGSAAYAADIAAVKLELERRSTESKSWIEASKKRGERLQAQAKAAQDRQLAEAQAKVDDAQAPEDKAAAMKSFDALAEKFGQVQAQQQQREASRAGQQRRQAGRGVVVPDGIRRNAQGRPVRDAASMSPVARALDISEDAVARLPVDLQESLIESTELQQELSSLFAAEKAAALANAPAAEQQAMGTPLLDDAVRSEAREAWEMEKLRRAIEKLEIRQAQADARIEQSLEGAVQIFDEEQARSQPQEAADRPGQLEFPGLFGEEKAKREMFAQDGVDPRASLLSLTADDTPRAHYNPGKRAISVMLEATADDMIHEWFHHITMGGMMPASMMDTLNANYLIRQADGSTVFDDEGAVQGFLRYIKDRDLPAGAPQGLREAFDHLKGVMAGSAQANEGVWNDATLAAFDRMFGAVEVSEDQMALAYAADQRTAHALMDADAESIREDKFETDRLGRLERLLATGLYSRESQGRRPSTLSEADRQELSELIDNYDMGENGIDTIEDLADAISVLESPEVDALARRFRMEALEDREVWGMRGDSEEYGDALYEGLKDLLDTGRFSRESQALDPRRLSPEEITSRQDALGFYSAAERAVEGLPQETFTPSQLKAMVSKAKGVKAQELVDTGFNDWLDGMDGKVTKAQAIAFLQEKGPKLEEVVLGALPYEGYLADIKEKYTVVDEGDYYILLDEHGTPMPESDTLKTLRFGSMDQVNGWLEREADNLFDSEAYNLDDTKFGEYQIPGGENYREVLLTLPRATMEAYEVRDKDGSGWKRLTSKEMAQTEADRIGGTVVPIQTPDSSKDFKSSHYPEYANPLAHFRLNDRTDADGRKTLMVEEIQSDWHQKGREKGYTAVNDPDFKRLKHLQDNHERLGATEEFHALWDKVYEKYNVPVETALSDFLSSQMDTVPDAPFKGSKSWAMLAFKRVLRMAAEQGYDSVAWTPGEVQNERYRLDKHVSIINFEKSANGDGYAVIAKDLHGKDIEIPNQDKYHYTETQIEETFGKGIAEKIVDQQSGTIKGEGLRLGGEGMKGFYDRILPTEVGKYVAKLDKDAKVGTSSVQSGVGQEADVIWTEQSDGTQVVEFEGDRREFATEAEARAYSDSLRSDQQEVWSLPITDKMRSTILDEGQGLFSRESQARDPRRLSPEEIRESQGRRQELWRVPDQAIHSADTSINQGKLPASFSRISWQSGTVNADIGGGRFDNATQMLAEQGVENVIYDPFNRTPEHNRAAVDRISSGGADTATVNNVLNVIREPSARALVVQQAADAVGPDGTAYFLLYEGDKSGQGKTTTKGWQENRRAEDYVQEVSQSFGNVQRKGNMLVATGAQGDDTGLFSRESQALDPRRLSPEEIRKTQLRKDINNAVRARFRLKYPDAVNEAREIAKRVFPDVKPRIDAKGKEHVLTELSAEQLLELAQEVYSLGEKEQSRRHYEIAAKVFPETSYNDLSPDMTEAIRQIERAEALNYVSEADFTAREERKARGEVLDQAAESQAAEIDAEMEQRPHKGPGSVPAMQGAGMVNAVNNQIRSIWHDMKRFKYSVGEQMMLHTYSIQDLLRNLAENNPNSIFSRLSQNVQHMNQRHVQRRMLSENFLQEQLKKRGADRLDDRLGLAIDVGGYSMTKDTAAGLAMVARGDLTKNERGEYASRQTEAVFLSNGYDLTGLDESQGGREAFDKLIVSSWEHKNSDKAIGVLVDSVTEFYDWAVTEVNAYNGQIGKAPMGEVLNYFPLMREGGYFVNTGGLVDAMAEQFGVSPDQVIERLPEFARRKARAALLGGAVDLNASSVFQSYRNHMDNYIAKHGEIEILKASIEQAKPGMDRKGYKNETSMLLDMLEAERFYHGRTSVMDVFENMIRTGNTNFKMSVLAGNMPSVIRQSFSLSTAAGLLHTADVFKLGARILSTAKYAAIHGFKDPFNPMKGDKVYEMMLAGNSRHAKPTFISIEAGTSHLSHSMWNMPIGKMKLKDVLLLPQGQVDSFTRVAAWGVAYERSMYELQDKQLTDAQRHEQSFAFAEDILNQSQPSPDVSGRAMIMKKNEWLKALTPFTGMLNKNWNIANTHLARPLGQAWSEGYKKGGSLSALAETMQVVWGTDYAKEHYNLTQGAGHVFSLTYVVPALALSTLARGRPPEDFSEFMGDLFAYNVAMIPILGPIVSAMWLYGRGQEGMPIYADLLNEAAKTIRDATSGEGERAVRGGIRTVAMSTGYPMKVVQAVQKLTSKEFVDHAGFDAAEAARWLFLGLREEE